MIKKQNISRLGMRARDLAGYWLVLAGALLTPASLVHAQNPLVPCSGLKCRLSDLFQLLVNIYNFLLGMAAIVAVLMIIVAGVRMLVYYWSEQPKPELEAAKNTLRRAIFGLVIIVTAYLVVNTLLAVLGAGSIDTFFTDFGG